MLVASASFYIFWVVAISSGCLSFDLIFIFCSRVLLVESCFLMLYCSETLGMLYWKMFWKYKIHCQAPRTSCNCLMWLVYQHYWYGLFSCSGYFHLNIFANTCCSLRLELHKLCSGCKYSAKYILFYDPISLKTPVQRPFSYYFIKVSVLLPWYKFLLHIFE